MAGYFDYGGQRYPVGGSDQFMSYGGRSVPYTGRTNAGFDPSSQGAMPEFNPSSQLERRWRRDAERRQEAEQRRQDDMITRLMGGMMGDPNPGQTPGYPRQPGFSDGPIMSEIPGSSYKTRGSAPQYHREMPYGGTPGVYAIRLDELAGPKEDLWQYMSPKDYMQYRKSGGGRRRRR
jgi:hypothetical protein